MNLAWAALKLVCVAVLGAARSLGEDKKSAAIVGLADYFGICFAELGCAHTLGMSLKVLRN